MLPKAIKDSIRARKIEDLKIELAISQKDLKLIGKGI